MSAAVKVPTRASRSQACRTVPDWFPQDHPTMPDVVAKGRVPGVGACGHCHLPTGMGRPENQSVAGLPEAYMLQQIEDFRSGARHSSEPHMASVNNMISTSRAATPDEIKAGASYFASLKPHKWIRVVEIGSRTADEDGFADARGHGRQQN